MTNNPKEFWHYIHSFISGMHHYQCVAPNVDINLQSGRFWATSIALFGERFIDFRSCWVVFIHMVQGCPGGLFQFSKGEDLLGIWFFWHSRNVAELCLNSSRKMWLLCFPSHIIIPHMLVPFDSQQLTLHINKNSDTSTSVSSDSTL